MFKILTSNEVQNRLKNLEKEYPCEVRSEIKHYIEILQRDGIMSKTDFYDTNTNKISGFACNIFFRTNFQKKEVLIIDIRIKIVGVLKQRFKIDDEWDDEEVLTIPQCDKPQKLIRTIELIYQGINDSAEIAYHLGNRANTKKDNARHGQYAKQALRLLKLAIKVDNDTNLKKSKGSKELVHELTAKGRLIAEATNNSDLQSRLLIESMLNYPPVWRIIDAVSIRESQLNNALVLSDQLIKKIAFREEFHGSDTSNRRSQTLKSWIKWISTYSGIPILLNESAVQLPIPMFHSQTYQADGE